MAAQARCALLLALVTLFSIACEPEPVLIIEEPSTEPRTHMPLGARVRIHPNAAPASFVATLNGVDVSAAFGFEPAGGGWTWAVAEDLWSDGAGSELLLPEETNSLVASVTLGGATHVAVRHFVVTGEPFADVVTQANISASGGYGIGACTGGIYGCVLGPPRGMGAFQGATTSVLSLGLGGSITLRFDDNVVVDGDGPDFSVFENAFLRDLGDVTGNPFAEPARVLVSQDGVSFVEAQRSGASTACDLLTSEGPLFDGCAGVYPVFANADDPFAPHATLPSLDPVSTLVGVPIDGFEPPAGAGGDAFDLAGTGLGWARYVRIVAASFVTEVCDPTGLRNCGFDLDAVAALHSVPEDDANGNGVPDALE
jgi:hypothetical protein